LLTEDANNNKTSEDKDKKEEEKKDVKVSDMLALKNLNIKVNKGEFICIIGDVGSGKSSLLSALIGDLQYLDQEACQTLATQLINDDEVKKKLRDLSQTQIPAQAPKPVKVYESISYVQQTPWIQNKTIRENILLNKEYDRARYQKIIKICQLSRDLEILPAGDDTEIGEKGINLSGGQKARVSLARAVYQDKDLILMDDPISALDANVKKSIF